MGLIKFKGTYLNRERKKGQEYDIYGNLQFEGEYSNRNKYLKGKEYIFKGNLVYEGEYWNGIKNGKGIYYDVLKNIKYDEEFINGNTHGKFKLYYNNTELIFEGIF